LPKTDSFSAFDDTLAQAAATDPWLHDHGQAPQYSPDYPLLQALLAIPVEAKKVAASGALANGVDLWLANEFRRAGFGPDEVWPRATQPRILPRDVAALLEKLPRQLELAVRAQLENMKSVAPTDAKILGRAYEKQVDVAIARWDRGPELLLSTKTQVSSFGKNLSNRFEEAYGDAGNLRSRYPLAAVGFFFVQRATILTDEPQAFEKTVDMMRKLRDLGGANGYTATGLALVDWPEDGSDVQVHLDRVPKDLQPGQFMRKLIQQILAATAVTQHVEVRNKIERRQLAVVEEDAGLDELDD
jgi:hypothetical protein